jgi:RNA polymerase sigma-70 factor (ECF subfamily)
MAGFDSANSPMHHRGGSTVSAHAASTPSPPDADTAAMDERTMPDPLAAESPGTDPRVVVLLAKAADGDQDAWREILGLYGRRVFAMAKSHLKRDDLAEEITQSVFVTLAQKLPGSGSGSYREHGTFEPWLFRITMNRVRDEARRAKRQATPTDPEQIASVMPVATAPEPIDAEDPERRRLKAALDRLDATDRQIIDLRHIGGLSFKQIAATLESPIGTVLARHHRALKKLRNILESEAFTQ